jgi:hypothetical protein
MVYFRGTVVNLGVLLEGFGHEKEGGRVVGHQHGLQGEHARLVLRSPANTGGTVFNYQ